MNQATTQAVVQEGITVRSNAVRAFEAFTTEMHKWWPEQFSIAGVPFKQIVIEPQAGGRWLERAASGQECDWGKVLAWEPPTKLVLAWHITPTWQFDPDPNHASQVEVAFEELWAHSTQVSLTHRGIELHGDGYEGLLAAVGEGGGWKMVLEAFAGYVGKV